jgi:excisionase family DNA binding protein
MNLERIYSLEEIAKIRGVGTEAIRRHVKSGALPAQRIGQRTFYIREHDLAHFNPRPYRKSKQAEVAA